MENVKEWLDKKGYYNSGLRTDRNHRIDLYLSDVLEEYKTELLNIHNVVGQSEQLLAVAEYVYNHFDDSSSKTAKDYLQQFLSQ